MALNYSTMLDLCAKLPDFELVNSLDGQKFNSDNLDKNKGKLVMFICNHCPFVIHYHQQLVNLAQKYSSKIEFVAISSNDAENYPQDGPEKMKELFAKLNLSFPYLYDESQEIAKKYKAACTPEFYLFDENNLLIYRGRMDDSSPQNGKEANGSDLKNAIDNFLNKKEISPDQYPSMGCNIKWKVSS